MAKIYERLLSTNILREKRRHSLDPQRVTLLGEDSICMVNLLETPRVIVFFFFTLGTRAPKNAGPPVSPFLAKQLRVWVLKESFVYYRKRSFDLRLGAKFGFYQSRASFWYPTWPAFLLWFAQVRSHTRSFLYYAYRTLTTSYIRLHIT